MHRLTNSNGTLCKSVIFPRLNACSRVSPRVAVLHLRVAAGPVKICQSMHSVFGFFDDISSYGLNRLVSKLVGMLLGIQFFRRVSLVRTLELSQENMSVYSSYTQTITIEAYNRRKTRKSSA